MATAPEVEGEDITLDSEVDLIGMPTNHSTVPDQHGSAVEERSPSYKSWKKKYKKLMVKFNAALQKSNELYSQDIKSCATAKRLASENVKLLDLLLHVNKSDRVSSNMRFEIPDSMNDIVLGFRRLDSDESKDNGSLNPNTNGVHPIDSLTNGKFERLESAGVSLLTDATPAIQNGESSEDAVPVDLTPQKSDGSSHDDSTLSPPPSDPSTPPFFDSPDQPYVPLATKRFSELSTYAPFFMDIEDSDYSDWEPDVDGEDTILKYVDVLGNTQLIPMKKWQPKIEITKNPMSSQSWLLRNGSEVMPHGEPDESGSTRKRRDTVDKGQRRESVAALVESTGGDDDYVPPGAKSKRKRLSGPVDDDEGGPVRKGSRVKTAKRPKLGD